jgi:hypothetical protein
MLIRSIWIGAVVLALVALAAISFTTAAPASASSNTSSTYSEPTWWNKYQIVSAPGFVPLAKPVIGKSILVGSNVDVSNEPGPQSETSIAINPNNGLQLVGGSNEIFRLPMRGYFSSNSGASWGAVDLPLPPAITTNGTDFGSDPGVAWDTRGNVYYSYIVVFFNRFFDSINGTELAIARSADGGHTWTATFVNLNAGTGKFNDKPMITVDTNPNSPFRDTIYVAWDNASLNQGKSSNNNVILVTHSRDGGRTWSTLVVASATNAGPRAVIGADPFVAPDGTLHIAWHDIQNNRLVESSSTDGGQTFSTEHTISPTQIPFDIGIPSMNTRRALLYPACGADTGSGINRGTLYCSWMDETATNGTDVLTARSTDGGVSWSAPVRVNDDPGGVANDQFNQWLAVDPSDGSISLSWNDTRLDAAHLSTNIFYARSTDGGKTFSANVQVTTAPTNETCCGADLGNQYGDYEGIAALGGIVHPIWTDRRSAVASLDEEVFTASIEPK